MIEFFITQNLKAVSYSLSLCLCLSVYLSPTVGWNCHMLLKEMSENRGGVWWQRQQQSEKERMFEKALTPSDVGKLNRLVIPKQHAEKYFPLSGESGDKGLLLSFEDESGKCWRFRYSYWNSSQSYVLTKGWSRYVKDKRLDAGDIIQFERHVTDSQRLFIGWRRRGTATTTTNTTTSTTPTTTTTTTTTTLPADNTTAHQGNTKRLRLFGVNLECQQSDDPSAQMVRFSLFSQYYIWLFHVMRPN